MNIFFFGDSRSPLFGAYHPPVAASARNEGVVLCPSVGHEMLKTHRAFKQLAAGLSRSGYHVLRFDYTGTGDSAGECEDGSVAQWVQDIGYACRELREIADVEFISLIGLRLGATVAALATGNTANIKKLVMWDPVVSGSEYLEVMVQSSIAAESDPEFEARLKAKLAGGASIGVAGFAFSGTIQRELQGLTVANLKQVCAEEALLLVSEESPSNATLRQALAESVRLGYECIPYPANWAEHDELGSQLLPQPMIRGILSWMQ